MVYVLGLIIIILEYFLIAPDDLVSRSMKITKYSKGYDFCLLGYNWKMES